MSAQLLILTARLALLCAVQVSGEACMSCDPTHGAPISLESQASWRMAASSDGDDNLHGSSTPPQYHSMPGTQVRLLVGQLVHC